MLFRFSVPTSHLLFQQMQKIRNRGRLIATECTTSTRRRFSATSRRTTFSSCHRSLRRRCLRVSSTAKSSRSGPRWTVIWQSLRLGLKVTITMIRDLDASSEQQPQKKQVCRLSTHKQQSCSLIDCLASRTLVW